MLDIKFLADDASKSVCIRLSGHAGAAEKGRDIVCAAASILAYAASGCAESLYADGHLAEPPICSIEAGDTTISVIAKDEDGYRTARTALMAVEIGFFYVAAAAPDHVQYTHR